ncbi:hypothetical protein V3C99_017239 [Haemonchus contortus]|uniref:Cnd1 domain-containing protein n=1 Tax=Haemonchus contortus TaxID=6289 RepID=A0A7I4Z5Y6_HAECO
MASIAQLIDFLRSEFSSVEDITDEWASSSVEGNYMDFPAISSVFTPSFYEDVRVTSRLRQLLTNLAQFEEKCDDPEVWNELINVEISGRQLCVLLWYSLEWALNKNSTFELVERGVLAACSYLHLASIKGSKAYHIFNPYLYQNKAKRKGKQKKRQEEMDVDEDEAEEEVDVARTFDKGEVKHLFEEASESLFVLLGKISLSSYAEIPLMTTMLVRDMARIDCSQDTKVAVVETLRDFKKLRKLSDRSFALMHRLIDSRHTPGGYLVISRIVYPRLAFWTFECDVIPSSTAIPTMFTTWRDLMVKFIKIRVELNNLGELRNFFAVLENLYLRCTDRLEYRTRLAQSVLNVLQLLPREYHYEFVQRIEVFSKNQRVGARNFAIEIVPLILKGLDLSGSDPGPIEYPPDGDVTGTEADKNAGPSSEAEAMDVSKSSTSDEEGDSDKSDSETEAAHDSTKREAKAAKSAAPVEQTEKTERVPALAALYRCVVRSCLDKASTVRLRAMFHLPSLLESEPHRELLIHHARSMFEETPKVFIGIVSEKEEGAENEPEEINENMFLDDSEIIIENLILHLILTGAGDDAAGVRKYAVIALQALFPFITEESDALSAVECLKECCLDSSLMVRKQAAEVLDSLLTSSQKFRDVLEEGWLAAVLPMVNDREQSVQQMISKIVTKTVVNPLMRDTDATAWKMLHAIELENNNRRLLSRALMQEHQEGNIKPALVECLNRKLGSCPGEMDVIWMLLADLSAIFKVNPKKALEAWYAIEDGDPMNRVRYVTRVLSRSYAHLDSRARADLCADIKTKITGFRIDAMNIPSAYLCLAKLMDAVGEESTGKKNLQKVGKQLLNISRSHIRESLQKIDDEYDYPDRLEARETLLIRVITTIGEVVQFSPRLMNAGVRLFDALKSIVSSDIFNEHELPVINAAIPSVHPTPISSRAPSPTSTHSRAPSPTPSMVSSNQDDNPISSQNLPVIPHHILEDASTNRRALLTPRVRAHAVLTIGKFCLMDEKIGKSTIPVFVKQLKLNSDHVIRNNIALVICDLCIRYTSMVDRYSPIVAACLKDTSTLVRKQILQSLTSLIKEQFIRWEGQIMYRFVSTILDENKIIMEYTKFCLRDVLLLQFPELFSSHFIECLMYFNNVPVSCEREVVQEVVDPAYRVSLHGPENEENRMTIYKFMLSTFDDTHKFTLMAHICTQIICPVMNGKLKLEDPCVFALMRDSLTVMSLKEIKLNMDVGKGPDEEDEPPAVVVAAAKEMITETFRKAMIEYVMPALLDLRVYLNERRSSLRGPLYCVFRAICREHKEQIDAFLDGDQQLKAEVEYDIYRFEMREKAERAAAKKRAEEAAKERRRSRRSMAVVNRPPEEDDEDVTQRSGGPQAAPDVVNVQASEEAAGIKQEPVEQEEDVVMREVTPEPQAPTEHVTAEIVLTQCQDKQLGISVVCGDGQRMDELVAALHEVQAGTAPAASSAPTGEFVPTAAGSSTENMVASSSEAPKSPDMVMDAQPAPQFEVEPVKSTAACEPTEKENQHTVEENSLRRSVRLASTPSSTAAGTRLSRRATSSVSDESVLPSRAVSTPNKPISDLTFGDLNLSAIEGDAKRISRKPGRPRLSRKEMENIEEENS